jgi:hypothetical protein
MFDMTPYFSGNSAYENNEDFKAFTKRKQTLLKSVERLLFIKFPDDMAKRLKYQKEVDDALNQEEA